MGLYAVNIDDEILELELEYFRSMRCRALCTSSSDMSPLELEAVILPVGKSKARKAFYET